MANDLTSAIVAALDCLSGAQDVVRHAHGAAQVGSLSLAEVRKDLAKRLGRVILDINPIKKELASLITAARVLEGLEIEEARERSGRTIPTRRKRRRENDPPALD
ncbi:MAG: hypothetical protein U0931_15040 [Vulcanimicrobiota bacterium]